MMRSEYPERVLLRAKRNRWWPLTNRQAFRGLMQNRQNLNTRAR